MSYKIVTFDGLNVPGYNRESGLDTAPGMNGFVATVAGGFDSYGSDIAPMAFPYPLTVRGIVSEEDDSVQRYVIDAERAKARVRGKLKRQPDDGSAEQWCWARLESIAHRRIYNHHGYQILEMTFQAQSGWYSDRANQVESISGSPHVMSVINDGNRMVTDAILTIRASGSPVTAVTITTANGTHLIWTGSLASGKNLVIDCGAKSIRNDGVNAYGGFSYGVNHSIDDWLRIAGTMNISIAYTGGANQVTIAYNDGWA